MAKITFCIIFFASFAVQAEVVNAVIITPTECTYTYDNTNTPDNADVPVTKVCTPAKVRLLFPQAPVAPPDEEIIKDVTMIDVPNESFLIMTWDIPTARVNGDVIPENEIAHYVVMYYREGQAAILVDVQTTQYVTPVLPPGKYFYAVKTVDIWALESKYTDEIDATIT